MITFDHERLATEILARVSPPIFADREFPVVDFGALSDGVTDCTEAFATAIAKCSEQGGGRVVVPAGRFHTGAIHLLDDVNLHLDDGAILAFSRDPEDYLPAVFTRYEGVELYNFSPFLYAYGRRNVAVTGRGVIDGQADDQHWWNWVRSPEPDESGGKRALLAAGAAGTPVVDRDLTDDHHLRPNLLQFYACTNVLIEGVTFRNSPMWTIHPVLCTNVTISDVTVDSHGPNNDGCNPESCTDVVITGCRFDSGDDCIAIKSGKDADGRRVGMPCTHVLIQDCEMLAGHGGVTIGSETSGGISDIAVRRCRMDSPDLKRGLRIKSNPDRGGSIHRVHYADIEIGTVAQAVIEIVLDYGRISTGDHPVPVSNITVTGLRARSGLRALRLIGAADNPLREITLTDCIFGDMREPNEIRHVEGLNQ